MLEGQIGIEGRHPAWRGVSLPLRYSAQRDAKPRSELNKRLQPGLKTSPLSQLVRKRNGKALLPGFLDWRLFNTVWNLLAERESSYESRNPSDVKGGGYEQRPPKRETAADYVLNVSAGLASLYVYSGSGARVNCESVGWLPETSVQKQDW